MIASHHREFPNKMYASPFPSPGQFDLLKNGQQLAGPTNDRDALVELYKNDHVDDVENNF